MAVTAVVYINHGRVVADCPRPGCAGAEHFGADPVSGYLGGLSPVGFRCANCELLCGATWPPNLDDLLYLLAMRPVPATRNWRPGETVHDLLIENLTHGISMWSAAEIESGERLAPILTVDDRIVGVPAVTAVRRLELLGRR